MTGANWELASDKTSNRKLYSSIKRVGPEDPDAVTVDNDKKGLAGRKVPAVPNIKTSIIGCPDGLDVEKRVYDILEGIALNTVYDYYKLTDEQVCYIERMD